MLDYFFPKIDIKSKKIGNIIDNYQKGKFIVHDEICFVCKKESKNFKTHLFCSKNINQLVTCFYYTNELKKYLLAFKYYHKKEVIKEIGNLMSIFYNIYFSNFKKEETVISFVPMHWFRKYFIKGYNQGELLAKQIGNNFDIQVIDFCRKNRYTKPQAKIKKRKDRLENLKGSFSCDKLTNNIKNIIIVDDILTTGATINELAVEIKKINPKINIYGLVLARK